MISYIRDPCQWKYEYPPPPPPKKKKTSKSCLKHCRGHKAFIEHRTDMNDVYSVEEC